MKAIEALASLYVDIEYCELAVDDTEISDFLKWLEKFNGFDAITSIVTENMHAHYQEIELKTAVTHAYLYGSGGLPKGFTYEFGYTLGDVTYLALGPVRDEIIIKPGVTM